MANRLIISAAWLVMASFFLFWNLKQSRGLGKIFSWWMMVGCALVSVVLLVNTSLEYYDG